MVADVTSTGHRSPERRTVEWLGEPARPVAAWRTARIVEADRGHQFVFATKPARGIYHDSTTWAYRLDPAGDRGTRVTESYLVRSRRWIQAMDTAPPQTENRTGKDDDS
jgi:hypothetical protein